MTETKIVNIACQDCGGVVMVFCSAGSHVVAVRCPACALKFEERGVAYNRAVLNAELDALMRQREGAVGVDLKRINYRIAEVYNKIDHCDGGCLCCGCGCDD